MFGSLRKKLEEFTAQANPFDNGKTAATVRASRNQPAPAQTISRPKQSFANKVFDQVSSNTQADQYRRQQKQKQIQDSTRGTDEAMRLLQKQALTGQVDKNVAAAKIRALGTSNVQPNTAENVLKPTTPAQIAGQKVVDSVMNRKVAPVALGVGRSVAGTVGGVAGLYDLASPGDGVNRVSKVAVKAGDTTDRVVKENSYNQIAYKGAQAGGDLATFAIGGAAGKALPSIKGVSYAARLAKPVSNVVGKGATSLASKGFAGRVAGKSLQNITKPGYQAANAGFTALQAGKEASHGTKVTPMGVTTNLVAGGVAFPVAGAVVGQTAKPVINAGVNQLRKTNLIRPSKLNPNEVADLARLNDTAKTGAIMEDGVYQRGVQAAQKAGVDYNNPAAVDDLLGKHRTFDTISSQRKQAIDEAKARLTSPRPLNNEIGAVGKNVDPLESLKQEAKPATGARSDYSPENLQANRQIRAKNASSITYADKKTINPDELVTVYRAVPGKAKGGLVEGDWVTPNKEQARLFMKQSWAQDDTGAKIVTKKVKASELRYHADDAKGYVDDELLYVPKADPLEALKQEARKYKSAEEFVNSQRLYKGLTKDGSSTSSTFGKAVYTSPHEHIAQKYDNGGGLVEMHLKPGSRTINWQDAEYKAVKEKFMEQVPGGEAGYRKPNYDKINTELKKRGYDAVTFATDGQSSPMTAILNKKAISNDTKQLTDLYNQATQPQPVGKDVNQGASPKPTIPDVKDVDGVKVKEGDTIEFASAMGDKMGRAKVHWSEGSMKNDGTMGEGAWVGNGSLDNGLPFRIVSDSKPTTVSAPKSPFEKDLQSAGFTGNKAGLPKENTVQTPKNQSQSTPKTEQPVAPQLAETTNQTKAPQTKGRATSSELGQGEKITSGTPKRTASQSPEVKSNIVNPSIRERGFVETIIDDPKTSPKVKENLSSLYSVRNTKQLQTKAANLVKTDPDLAMRVAREDTSDIGVATGSELIKKLQQDGNYEQAIDLATNVAETLTRAGQTSQAASIYGKLTPEGILRFTQKEINAYNKATKKNIKLSPEQAKSLTEKAQKIQEMPEGRPRDIATQQMLKELYETMPSTWVEKVSTFQTMAQLLNPKTLIRNLGGNTIFSVLDNSSQVLATGIDKAISGVRGTPRTTTLPSIKTQAKGLKKGFNEGYEEAVKGINLGPRTQFELNDVPVFRDGLLGKAETGLNLSLRATDRAAYTAAFDDTLKGLMKTNKVKTATTEMIEMAHQQGLYRTFQDESNAAKIFVGLKKALNIAGFEQNGKRWGLGDLILKYPKTPGNLIARGIDYSPVGIVKGMINLAQLNQGPAKQQAAANSLARGVTGTGSLIGTGYVLAGLGLITEKPEENKDLRNLQKSAGLGGYQLNTSGLRRFLLSGFDTEEAKLKPGDKLVSYDWAQPAAIPLSMGASMGRGEGVKKGANQGLNALSEGVETLAEQPLVRGVQQFFGSNKSAIDSVIDTAKSAPASFVPTLSNQVRQLADNTTRNTSDPSALKEAYNKAINRVPWIAGQLPAQVDTLGNDKKNFQNDSNNPFNVFLNPSFVNKYQPNNVATTNLDLNRATGETKQLPNTVSNKVKINGQDKVLTGKEQGDYQRFVGQTNSTITDTLTKNPRFNALPDTQKVNLLASMQTDINNAAKVNLFGDNPEKLSESVDSILSGNVERAIELKLKTQEKTVEKKSGKKVAKAKKAKSTKKKTAKKGKGGKKGGKKKSNFDYTKNLFASGGSATSGSVSKSLRSILANAQKSSSKK